MKALLVRHYGICWTISVMWEVSEVRGHFRVQNSSFQLAEGTILQSMAWMIVLFNILVSQLFRGDNLLLSNSEDVGGWVCMCVCLID